VQFHDVTRLKQVEAELREANERKDEFLAMLAHELRNPLGAIGNAVGVLQQAEPGTVPYHRGLEVARRQVQHQSQIVDDLLDLSRISRGKMEVRREPLDLSQIIQDAVEDFRREFERRGVSLAVELPTGPVPVRGDVTRLAQAVGNLLHNASKFAPSGEQVAIQLTVADAAPARGRAGLPAPEGGEQDSQPAAVGPVAVVRVRDTGIGISPEMLPRLFQPFAQADRTLDRARGGLGLGLAIVKGFLTMHGGDVWGDSAGEGQGAEFTFYLPLDREPEPAPAAPAAIGGISGPQRVLVIEDIPDAADTLRDLLELFGYEVEVAYTGPTGVEAAERFRPDVILCDIGLPGMDGYAVAEELRRRPATATVRLIALTGYGQEEDRRRSEAAGFDLHLTKPVDPERLSRLLASAAPAQRSGG